jgi:hypothetical protein
VKLASIFALCLFVQTVAAQDAKGVSWSVIDPFCGQVKSSDSKFPVSSATVKLYRAKAKHLPCCSAAERLDDVRTDKDGNFDLRKLTPGEYWFVITWGKTEVPVTLWFDGKHDFACDESYKNVIEVHPSTKTAEGLVVISNDSLAHAQTH